MQTPATGFRTKAASTSSDTKNSTGRIYFEGDALREPRQEPDSRSFDIQGKSAAQPVRL